MAHTLDLRTLGVAIMLVDAALGAALVLFWRTQKTYPGFGHWTLCQAVALVAYLLLSVRGALPAPLLALALGGLMVAGATLRSLGILLFFGRARGYAADAIAGAVTLFAIAWFSLVTDAPAVRVLAAVLGVAFVMGRATAALGPALRTSRAQAAVAIAFLLLWPAVLLAFVAAWAASAPGGTVFAFAAEIKEFLLFLLVYDVAITIFYLMLNTRRLAAELVATQSALKRLAATDELTGLPNRRQLHDRLEREWERGKRSRAALSLLVVDIDHFKAFNDRHGHPEGDTCLVRLAGAMQGALRGGTDLLVRLGGEEFVALLPEAAPEEAAAVAERVRAQVESLALPHGASPTAPVVTVSVGWASTSPATEPHGPAALLARADAALYRAKREGRNTVAAAAPAAVPAP